MSLEGMTVLVTGATGFLGGALSRRLANAGARVRALARTPERAAVLRGIPGIDIVYGDVTAPDSLPETVRDCQIVFHVAVSFGSRQLQQAVNVEGTRHIATAAADAGINRLVHVSSIAAYGYAQEGVVTEDTPLATVTHDPYSETKAEGERVLRAVASERGLSYSIIRPGMIYGPKSSMWTERLFRLARLRPTPFIGDGSGATHPIYVDDVIDLLVIAATHPAADGQAFNATPDPASTWRAFIGEYQRLAGHQRWFAIPVSPVRRLVTALAALAPAEHLLKAAPVALDMMLRPSLVFRNAKARQLLGWEPRTDLRTGVERCAPWLRERGLLR